MDRIINVKVGGNYLSKDNKNAGVRGEANVTKLRITFDEGWDGYAIKVIFWDARGLNPVSISLLPHLAESKLIYLVPIPAEPLKETGKLTFVIEGSIDDKVQRSLSDTLEVKESPTAKNAGQPVPPTPDALTQLWQAFAKINSDIWEVRETKIVTEQFAKDAKESCETIAEYSETVEENKNMSAMYSEVASGAATLATQALTKQPVIVDGYWYVWDAASESYVSTGVKGQAGSNVYLGDNPPDYADVWIDPDGDTDGYATIKFVETRLLELANKVAPSPASVTLYADRWKQSENEQRWHQEVEVANADITEYSKIDLQLSAEQIMIFYEKDLAFVTENDGGKVTVYCIGRVPENDYVIQATVSEVVING